MNKEKPLPVFADLFCAGALKALSLASAESRDHPELKALGISVCFFPNMHPALGMYLAFYIPQYTQLIVNTIISQRN